MGINVGCMTLTKKARDSGNDQRNPAVLSRYAPQSRCPIKPPAAMTVTRVDTPKMVKTR